MSIRGTRGTAGVDLETKRTSITRLKRNVDFPNDDSPILETKRTSITRLKLKSNGRYARHVDGNLKPKEPRLRDGNSILESLKSSSFGLKPKEPRLRD